MKVSLLSRNMTLFCLKQKKTWLLPIEYSNKILCIQKKVFFKYFNVFSIKIKGWVRATIIKSAEKVHLILVCYLADALRCAVSADLKMIANNHPLLKINNSAGLSQLLQWKNLRKVTIRYFSYDFTYSNFEPKYIRSHIEGSWANVFHTYSVI